MITLLDSLTLHFPAEKPFVPDPSPEERLHADVLAAVGGDDQAAQRVLSLIGRECEAARADVLAFFERRL